MNALGSFAIALVFAHPPSIAKDGCHDYQIQVARLQYAAFTDPTDDHWVAIWQRRPAPSTPRECDERIDSFTNIRSAVSAECRRRWEGAARDLTVAQMRAIAAIYERFPEDKNESIRRRRFLALLDNPDAWRWAAQQLVGHADPREWNPEDVALVVVAARRMDTRAVREIEEARKGSSLPDGYTELPPNDIKTPALNWIENYIYLLGRMGFRRVMELVRPTSISITGVNAPSILKEPLGTGGYFVDPLPGHFPLEGVLCQHDWESQTLAEGRPWFGGAPGRPRRLWGYDRAKYCAEKWEETDAAAPHPSLRSVQEAVDRLESELGQPDQEGGNR